MRRRFVLAIALLSTCLTAGTCEFRAASNTPIQRPPSGENPSPTPTQEGLVVVVSVGDPGDSSSTTAAATQIAMAASVLSSDGFDPEPATPATTFDPRFEDGSIPGEFVEQDGPSNPVPEPTALTLFGAAMALVGWRMSRCQSPHESVSNEPHQVVRRT